MVGDDHTNIKSVIQCASGSLGFVFINVTSLKITNLKFSLCGAPFPSNSTVKGKFVYPHDYKSKLAHTQVIALYFLQRVNVTISKVAISNSTGTGLLGINMLGLSNISQTAFSGNKPNCLLIFLDIPFSSEIILLTVFNLVNSQIISSKSTLQKNYWEHEYLGLSATLAQTTYSVHINIMNITTCVNSGRQSGFYGSLHITIENWMCQCSVIQAKQITTTNTQGGYDVAHIFLKYGNSSSHTSTCASEKYYMVHISESQFVGTIIWMRSDKKYCNAKIKLQNITIQNCTHGTNTLYILGMSSIKLKNIKLSENFLKRGMVTSNRHVSVYGNNYFYHNTGHYISFSLRSIVSIYGNIKFISNKVKWKWGGTVVLRNSTIEFRQTAELVKNEGKAGGAIALYENSQLVFWEQSRAMFLRNHAEKNGGAILADASTLVFQRGANISFIENNGHDGGALALKNGAMICIRGSHGKIMFTQNHAQHYGGALYVTNTHKKIPCV